MFSKYGLGSVVLLCETCRVDNVTEFVLVLTGAPVRRIFLPMKQVTDCRSFKPNLMNYGGSISLFLVGKNYLVFPSQAVSQGIRISVSRLCIFLVIPAKCIQCWIHCRKIPCGKLLLSFLWQAAVWNWLSVWTYINIRWKNTALHCSVCLRVQMLKFSCFFCSELSTSPASILLRTNLGNLLPKSSHCPCSSCIMNSLGLCKWSVMSLCLLVRHSSFGRPWCELKLQQDVW